MNMKDIEKLIEKARKDKDPNSEIVLSILAGTKGTHLDGQFAAYCQEFSKKILYDLSVGNLTIDDFLPPNDTVS